MFHRETSNESLFEFAPFRSPDVDGAVTGLESRFDIHDDNHIELKLDYAINEDSKWTRYQTEAFIFVPESLGVSRRSYESKQFFADMQAYIRFKTPQMSFAAIVNPEVTTSPIARLRRLLVSPAPPELAQDRGPLSRELRMFGCLVRANLRDAVATIRKRLEDFDQKSSGREARFSDLTTSVERMTDDLNLVCGEFRSLRQEFVGVHCPDWLREQFECTDEFISISVESYLTEIMIAIQHRKLRDKRRLRDLTDGMWSRLADVITREQVHRDQLDYKSTLNSKRGRMSFVNRSSALKKYVTSVLFLKIKPRRDGINMLQLGAGVAAALAMAFSMTAAFVSERIWGLNSVPFLAALVIGYVLKDRIKDWLKSFFSARVVRWLPDRSLAFVDPGNGTTVGHCRETFSFLKESRIPQAVRHWRSAGAASPSIDAEHNQEVVIHYVKNVAILGKRISDLHDRRRGVNDIIRWNVSSFLSRMDDPERVVNFLDPNTHELKSAVCPKRYQMNVVLVLKDSGRLVSVQRYRVQLDRSGIQSLESVGLDGPVDFGSENSLQD